MIVVLGPHLFLLAKLILDDYLESINESTRFAFVRSSFVNHPLI